MKSRRGISTVVGAVFAIIALGTTVGYITYSMTTLDNYNQTVLARNQQNADIANEKFQVSSATFVNSKLNITVLDTGSLPINITKIWISNQTTSCTTWSCNINYITNKVASPGLTQTNIGQSMAGSLNINKPYNVKLVTSRGNTIQFNVNSANTAPLDIQFYSLPSNVDANYTTEMVMVVRNNGTGTLTNLSAPQPSSVGSATVLRLSAVSTPASYNTLLPGGTAVFKWDVALTGNAGQSKTFTASLTNPFPGNTASTTVTLGTTSHASVAPLNIQLMALPATVPSGFKTELVMVVTNNGSGTLTNIAPSALPTPSYTGSAGESCQAGAVSPATYTLAPGSTGIFKWDVVVTGGAGDTCTYTITTPLQSGYSQTVTATITTTVVSLSSTTYSQSAGVVTLNYTSFKWTQTGQGAWKSGFSFSSSGTTAFKLNMTNNNSTGKLWLAKKTLLLFYSTHISPSQQPTPFYIVNFTNAANMATTKYDTCNGQSDYCLSIPPLGSATLYLAAATKGTNTAQNFGGNADINTVFLLIFGKYTATQTAAGPEYAQNTPYIAADVT